VQGTWTADGEQMMRSVEGANSLVPYQVVDDTLHISTPDDPLGVERAYTRGRLDY
jgi:hypothetical protein